MNVYFLLDRSGSMSKLWNEALSAINAYVEKLEPDTRIVLAAFDNEYTMLRNCKAKKWKNVTNEEVSPRGMTALFDASARLMHRALDDNAEKTMFISMTDGEENASQHFKQADVKSLASKFEKKNWEVIFLGANFDKVGDTAAQYGVASNKFTNITRENLGNFMETTLVRSTAAYSTGHSVDFTDDIKTSATK